MNDKKFTRIKVQKSLKKLLGIKYANKHEISRFNLLGHIIGGLIIGGDSRISHIAQEVNEGRRKQCSVKKQVSRFIENEHINYDTYFLPYVKELLASLIKRGSLTIIIDGSVICSGCMTLMFSVVYKNRALPLVWKVYRKKKGHFKESEHVDLLEKLYELIPKGVKVTVLGDGEFDGSEWQDKLQEYEWDYVLRTAKSVALEDEEGEVFKTGSVLIEEGEDLFIENLLFGEKHLVKVNLMVWHGKGYESPLYLVTNLSDGNYIKSFYIKRFLIETFFRDTKSKGFNIQKSGLRDPKKANRLLMCCCIAYILCILSGIKASKSVFYNSVCEQKEGFLSLFQLGLRFIRKLVDLRQWRGFSWKFDFF